MITHASKSIFRLSYDLRKYYFTNRALNIWNSLPNHVVLSDTVNMFKSRLDKFWQHQDLISRNFWNRKSELLLEISIVSLFVF